MFTIQLKATSGDAPLTLTTNGQESFEKLLARAGKKGYVVVDSEGAQISTKKTPLEALSSPPATATLSFDLVRLVRVFDPINKQPYRLRFGGEKTEVLPTLGLDSYLSRAAGNKRVFLCKKYQAKQCRAQGKCNSIHADRKRVAELRELHPASAEAIKSEKLIEVFSEADNERFSVPLDRVLETRGSRLLADDSSQGSASSHGAHVGTLCPMHDQKVPDCAQGELCENIHIDPAYLRHTKSMWKMPCCAEPDCCGNANATNKKQLAFPSLAGGKAWEFFQVSEGAGSGIMHPRLSVTPTKGLKELCEAETGDVLVVGPTNICRPHQRKACKWGVDCNNVHICRIRLPAASSARAAATGCSGNNCSAAAAAAASRICSSNNNTGANNTPTTTNATRSNSTSSSSTAAGMAPGSQATPMDLFLAPRLHTTPNNNNNSTMPAAQYRGPLTGIPALTGIAPAVPAAFFVCSQPQPQQRSSMASFVSMGAAPVVDAFEAVPPLLDDACAPLLLDEDVDDDEDEDLCCGVPVAAPQQQQQPQPPLQLPQRQLSGSSSCSPNSGSSRSSVSNLSYCSNSSSHSSGNNNNNNNNNKPSTLIIPQLPCSQPKPQQQQQPFQQPKQQKPLVAPAVDAKQQQQQQQQITDISPLLKQFRSCFAEPRKEQTQGLYSDLFLSTLCC